MVHVGLSGVPGVGKTTAVKRIIELLKDRYKLGGFYTEEVREDGRRVGFKVRDIMTGEEVVFAHVDFDTRYRVKNYKVDVERFESVGLKAVERAIEEADIIIIDELGKMELLSEKFEKAVLRALDSGKPVILTMPKKSREAILQDIRRRTDVRIIEITPLNRNIIPYRVLSILGTE